LSARHGGQRGRDVVVPAEAETAAPAHASPARVARQAGAPVPRAAPRGSVAASKTKPSNGKKAAPLSLAATRKNIPAAATPVAREKTIAGGKAPERNLSNRPEPVQAVAVAVPQPAEAPKSEVKSEAKPEVNLPPPATLEIAATPAASEKAALPVAAADASAPASRTIQQRLVEATGMADLVTAIGTGRQAANKSDNPAPDLAEARDADKAAPAAPDDPDLVALVLARPEINSLSDLNNKSIAIEEKQSASSGRVSAALMAAGAAEVQFSEGQRGAIERLISGEVPAAVLTLASREAAEWFPDIEGFRTFRVPLKARL
jgi:hypothetical protein